MELGFPEKLAKSVVQESPANKPHRGALVSEVYHHGEKAGNDNRRSV